MSARRLVSTASVWFCAVVVCLLLWSVQASAQREHVFSTSFGTEGAGNGQLLRPGALAVNEATGDVYVIDRGNSRVEVFSSAGAYVSQFNGSASPTGAFSWPVEGVEGHKRNFIAIDNSTNPLDPSAGDVYVVDAGNDVIDKFTAGGAYIGQIAGFAAGDGGGIEGITVDHGGSLRVEALFSGGGGYEPVDEYNDALANEFVSQIVPRFPFRSGQESGELGEAGLAVDSEENFYIGELLPSGTTLSAKFNKKGELLAGEIGNENTSALAVDLSSNDLYTDDETSVAAFSPTGSSIERFGSGDMVASEGMAVSSSTGTVYTSNSTGQDVDVFTAFVVPDVTTGSASNFGETSVTVSGTVNPDGLPVSSCVFEYGTSASYGQSVPCSQSPGSAAGAVTVSAQLTGLERLTGYHFRLNVSNANGSNQGSDRSFITPEPVEISGESVSDVSSTSALFSAQLDPNGADTTYYFEYGASVAYGESVPVPAGLLQNGTSGEQVTVSVQGLLAQTTYHVRVVATNLLGTKYGSDETFTTQAAGGVFTLPDGRAWEMVSPPNKYGASIEPIYRGMVEASADGDAVTYIANGPVVAEPAGNPSPVEATQVLSKRGAGNWSSQDIATPHRETTGVYYSSEYRLFSSDLSRALVEPLGETPLSSEATEKTLYLRDDGDGSYIPLVTPQDVASGIKFGHHRQQTEDVKALLGNADLSHVLLRSSYALTSNETTQNGDIYEWSAGRLQPVNILPDGTVANGTGVALGEGYEDTRHALSSNGSRVFWETQEGQGRSLYMRDTVAHATVSVDAPAAGVSQPPSDRAKFQIASADGSKVFFLDEQPLTLDSTLTPVQPGFSNNINDLYVDEVATGKLTDLSVDHNGGEQSNVQNMVVGASEDGSVVYFVATGVLATGAEVGKGNLYVESEVGSTWSPPRLVAVLSEEDNKDWTGSGDGSSPQGLSSEVSPNGRYLAFMSEKSLTGYDNRDESSGQPDEEVFVYDEQANSLNCVSCNRTGARPDGLFERQNKELLVDYTGVWNGHWLAAIIPGWAPIEPASYQPRYLSDEGRLFFDSSDALVGQDTNGREDVYEYEPSGVGSCALEVGCVALISSGTSSEESAFLDASEGGNDVFFLTASRLVAQDYDTSLDVYDAHACSSSVPCVSAPVSPPECTSGDSCKAAPSLQPEVFGAPASATFAGTGNVAPSPSTRSAVKSTKKGAKKKSTHRKKKKSRKRKRKGKGRGSRARKSLSARTRQLGGAGK